MIFFLWLYYFSSHCTSLIVTLFYSAWCFILLRIPSSYGKLNGQRDGYERRGNARLSIFFQFSFTSTFSSKSPLSFYIFHFSVSDLVWFCLISFSIHFSVLPLIFLILLSFTFFPFQAKSLLTFHILVLSFILFTLFVYGCVFFIRISLYFQQVTKHFNTFKPYPRQTHSPPYPLSS